MSNSNTMPRPFKVIHDRRLAYLVGLENFYKAEGYTTKLRSANSLLEVYPVGCELPKTQEEQIIEKWID